MSASYNPQIQPVSAEWLSLDESDRSLLVLNSHVGLMGRGQRAKAHAAMHVLVENQLALGFEPTVQAVERLQLEGLSRHDSVHAVALVVAEHIFNVARLPAGADAEALQSELTQNVERLTAKSWLAER